MNDIKFRPFGDRYLVLPDEPKEESKQVGEFTISHEANVHEVPQEGKILKCGPDTKEATGGMRVLFGKFSGYEQIIDGVKYKILAESELLGERLQ